MSAEELAERLRAAHPEVEPSEIDPGTLSLWVADAGADPDDDPLVSRALVAWEHLIV